MGKKTKAANNSQITETANDSQITETANDSQTTEIANDSQTTEIANGHKIKEYFIKIKEYSINFRNSLFTKRGLGWIALLWIVSSVLYVGWLYIPNRIASWGNNNERPFPQKLSRENLGEFEDIFKIFFIPLGLIGLGYTYVRTRDERDRNKTKAAHELVIKTLDKVYDIRGKFNDIYFSARHLETLDTQQKNHINHLLNILEEICIAIDDGIIDEETVNSNLIYILAEQRFLFANYIEEQRKGYTPLKNVKIKNEKEKKGKKEKKDKQKGDNEQEKYKPWGYLTNKINTTQVGEFTPGSYDAIAQEIVEQVEKDVNKKLECSIKILKLTFKNHVLATENEMCKELEVIIQELKKQYPKDIIDISLFQQSELVDSLIKFLVIYLKSDSQATIDFDSVIGKIKNSLRFYKKCQVIDKSSVETAYYIRNTRVDKMTHYYRLRENNQLN